MIDRFLAKIFGTQHERDLKKLAPRVERINALEPGIQKLSDEELRGKTAEFRARIARAVEGAHEDDRKAARDAVLDEILEEAFAVAREASVRALGMRPFDVQLIGGMVLHQGKIAEMKTGEGKTLVATMPVYLNALTGRGVHVVTVNDYLARRDAEWMGKIYRFLGLTVGCIQNNLLDDERKKAYACDVTYGTNNEFGFDYLRDNMKFELDNMVQRAHVYAIVDEVDSILIDEARTPLIISGPSEENTDVYYRCNRVIPHLAKGKEEKDKHGNKTTTGDYLVDEKARTAVLTEEGVAKAEKLLGIDNMYELTNIDLLHGVEQALRAHALYRKDVEYMIKDGQVLIVDEFTGRVLPGRRWSDGLHQAVEAKENVKIERENQTLATITLQNYFRLYEKLAGMTGTADTEASEFHQIYKLDVVVIPTNMPMIREDHQDVVYASEREKYDAVADEIVALREKGQPVLVGTVSIEKSETLSELLKKRKVPHVVLNAKFHEKEAEIVVQAGRSGSVTIATNMAGRGTDIVLGGNPEAVATHELAAIDDAEERARRLAKLYESCAEDKRRVLAAGGLHIIGTERHESRRVDNQLRGRSGRQGDPGSSRFYLSLEDDLMRIFGSDRLQNIMRRLGMEEGVPIEHGMVSRSIERAQKQVEGRNFETRKHLLEYDDVMNRQREEIYGMRRGILKGELARDHVLGLAETILDYVLGRHLDENKGAQEWDLAGRRRRPAGVLRPEGRLDPVRREDPRGDPRGDLGGADGRVRPQGVDPRRRDDADAREVRHAPGRRPAVEGPPPRDRPPQGGHRPAGLRPARPAHRVQEGVLRALHADEGAHRGPDRPVPVQAPARAEGGGRSLGGGRPPPDSGRDALPPGAVQRQLLVRRRGLRWPGREGRNHPAPGAQGRPQRSVPLRLRPEIQEVPRSKPGGGGSVMAKRRATRRTTATSPWP